MSNLLPPDQLNQSIGACVKTARKRSGLTQVHLAPMLGLDQSALSLVESGTQQLSAAQWFIFRDLMRKRRVRLVFDWKSP